MCVQNYNLSWGGEARGNACDHAGYTGIHLKPVISLDKSPWIPKGRNVLFRVPDKENEKKESLAFSSPREFQFGDVGPGTKT